MLTLVLLINVGVTPMARLSVPAIPAKQAHPSRLLGPEHEHERALQAAAEDRDRARGELLALLFTLPGKAWSVIRDNAAAARHRRKPLAGAR
jgi:hypothetical protein